jgi:hypothetical protein
VLDQREEILRDRRTFGKRKLLCRANASVARRLSFRVKEVRPQRQRPRDNSRILQRASIARYRQKETLDDDSRESWPKRAIRISSFSHKPGSMEGDRRSVMRRSS